MTIGTTIEVTRPKLDSETGEEEETVAINTSHMFFIIFGATKNSLVREENSGKCFNGGGVSYVRAGSSSSGLGSSSVSSAVSHGKNLRVSRDMDAAK